MAIRRRELLSRILAVPAAAAGLSLLERAEAAQATGGGPIRVTIWDEQQPIQKEAYENFLGNEIAAYLRKQGGFEVRSVRMDDPEQGLPKELLDNTDVLVWWGHARHREVKKELVQDIARRVEEGQLSLLALHSAHWALPFIEVMNRRSIADAMASLTEAERKNVEVRTVEPKWALAPKDGPLTPSFTKTTAADGKTILEVKLPSCVFPVVRNDGKVSHIRVARKNHPIARGIPETFDIPRTEVYGGPFHVPKPDVVVFEERWDAGEEFPAGCAWRVGKGRVFYFRPGHETYPIFKQAECLKIVENAARWLASRRQRQR